MSWRSKFCHQGNSARVSLIHSTASGRKISGEICPAISYLASRNCDKSATMLWKIFPPNLKRERSLKLRKPQNLIKISITKSFLRREEATRLLVLLGNPRRQSQGVWFRWKIRVNFRSDFNRPSSLPSPDLGDADPNGSWQKISESEWRLWKSCCGLKFHFDARCDWVSGYRERMANLATGWLCGIWEKTLTRRPVQSEQRSFTRVSALFQSRGSWLEFVSEPPTSQTLLKCFS